MLVCLFLPDQYSPMSSTALTLAVTDLTLLRRIARGDEEAFGRLYDAYSQPIYNYTLSLVKEPAAAEEILQEVFLAVWRGAHRFREQAQVKTWLFRIAHNQALTWLRQNKATVPLLEAEDIPDEVVLEDLFVDVDSAALRAALFQLGPKHLAVVELVFVYNLSYSEVADVVGIPLGTVKSRMSHALHYLSRFLAKE